MTSIQRFTKHDLELADEPEGEWVKYADHMAAVAEVMTRRIATWDSVETYTKGYAAALDAARDAVAALFDLADTVLVEVQRDDALAAIDALRGQE